MPEAPKTEPEDWFSKADIARKVFACSPQNFDKTYRPVAPKTAVRKYGTSIYFHARSLIDALIEQAKRGGGVGDDPMLAGVDSPGLERYRNANADLREMERDRQRAKLIDRNDLEPAMMQMADVLRGAGETLARLYGNEAAGVLNEAMDEFIKGVEKLFKLDDSDTDKSDADATEAAGDENQNAETADVETVR